MEDEIPCTFRQENLALPIACFSEEEDRKIPPILISTGFSFMSEKGLNIKKQVIISLEAITTLCKNVTQSHLIYLCTVVAIPLQKKKKAAKWISNWNIDSFTIWRGWHSGGNKDKEGSWISAASVTEDSHLVTGLHNAGLPNATETHKLFAQSAHRTLCWTRTWEPISTSYPRPAPDRQVCLRMGRALSTVLPPQPAVQSPHRFPWPHVTTPPFLEPCTPFPPAGTLSHSTTQVLRGFFYRQPSTVPLTLRDGSALSHPTHTSSSHNTIQHTSRPTPRAHGYDRPAQPLV